MPLLSSLGIIGTYFIRPWLGASHNVTVRRFLLDGKYLLQFRPGVQVF